MHFVQVNKCRADMVGECTPEPICKPLPALPLVETCEEVPGGNGNPTLFITLSSKSYLSASVVFGT